MAQRVRASFWDSTLFGPSSWNQGGRKPGFLHVINVDEEDKPSSASAANTRKWREVLLSESAGLEPFRIAATSEADKLLVTSRLDLSRGLRTVVIKSDNPLSFDLDLAQIDLRLNKNADGSSNEPHLHVLAGDFYYPTVTITRGNRIDLNIRNATGVAVSADLQYAFVADWYVPRMYYMNSMDAVLLEEKISVGSKVGFVYDPFNLKDQKGWNVPSHVKSA